MKTIIKAIGLTFAILMDALVSAAPAQDAGTSIDATVDTSEALCCMPGCYYCVQIDCGKSALACTSMNLVSCFPPCPASTTDPFCVPVFWFLGFGSCAAPPFLYDPALPFSHFVLFNSQILFGYSGLLTMFSSKFS